MSNIDERRRFIKESINKHGFVKVADLAKTFGVTQTTIRKDLSHLESKGLLRRAYGSALPTESQIMDVCLKNKKMINYDKKQSIARYAVQLIEENDSIMISSGSTTAIFSEHIQPKGHLNIVTSAVNISALLGEINGITVMQIGGILYSNTLSVTGTDAFQSIRNVYCSKLFIGIDGFDPDYGITAGTTEEAELIQQMMKSSSKTVVLCDSSKLGCKGFGRICGMEKIDMLITDNRLDNEKCRQIRDMGVEVVLT